MMDHLGAEPGFITAQHKMLRPDRQLHFLWPGLGQALQVRHGEAVASANTNRGAAVHTALRHRIENIGTSDEGGHEQIGRMAVNLPRGADLLDHSRPHDGNPVGDGHRLLLVMGHINGGDAHLPLNAFDGVAHIHPQLGIQVGQRLIHQQHVRVDDNGAGQCHTLLLPAGQIFGHPS